MAVLDDSTQGIQIAALLEQLGWRSFVAETVDDAFYVVGSYSVQVLIVNDRSEGDDSGLLMCWELKSITLPSPPRIVMLSTQLHDRRLVIDAGVDFEIQWKEGRFYSRRRQLRLLLATMHAVVGDRLTSTPLHLLQ
jgi:DNA-binding response OmpR family regulator